MLSPTIRGNRARMRLLAVFQAMLLVASLVAIAPVAAADPSPDPSTAATPSVEPTAPPPTPAPTPDPTPTATPGPTPAPSVEPSVAPSAEPSIVPSFEPSSSVAPSPSTIAPRIKTGAAGTGPLVASVGALQLNGTTQYATLGTTSQLGSATFTVELWFKRTGAGIGVSTGTGGGLASVIPLITKGRGGGETDRGRHQLLPRYRRDERQARRRFRGRRGRCLAGPQPPDHRHGGHRRRQCLASRGRDLRRHDLEPLPRRRTGRYLERRPPGQRCQQRADRGRQCTGDHRRCRTASSPARSTRSGSGAWPAASRRSTPRRTPRSRARRPTCSACGTSTRAAAAAWATTPVTASPAPPWPARPGSQASIRRPSNSAPNAPTLNAPCQRCHRDQSPHRRLSVGVSDPNADPLTVTFFGRPFASGNFAQIGQNTGVASGANDHQAMGEPRRRPEVRVVRHRQRRRPSPRPARPGPSTPPRAPTRCSSAPATSPTAREPRMRRPVRSSAASRATSGPPATTSTKTGRRPSSRPVTTPVGAARSRPALGRSPATTTGTRGNLNGYTGYFGAAATDANGKSYYSYDIASSNWHIVNLDTECALVTGGCARGLPAGAVAQGRPGREQHQERDRPVHKPRYSSAVTNLTDLQAFYTDFYEFGVDILLRRAMTTSTSGWRRSTPSGVADADLRHSPVHGRDRRCGPPGLRDDPACQPGRGTARPSA